MFLRLLVTLSCAVGAFANADDLTIFDARKSLSLSDAEPSFRDFYINGGIEAGIKAGMVFSVIRRIPLYDSYENRSPGDLVIKVGKIKIVHAQKGISVARLHNMMSRENLPLLEDNFVMIGDKLDISSGETDKKSADNTTPSPAPAVVPVPAPVAPAAPAQVELKPVDDQAAAKTIQKEQAFAIDFASKSPETQVPPVQVPVVQ